MKIACDPTTLVVLTGDAPSTWNGLTLIAYDLTADQETAWNALPADRAGTKFDGVTFTAIPAAPVPLPTLASITGARVGSVTISDTATTAQVTFPNPVADTNYKVFPTVSGFTGSVPPVGARVVNVNGNTKTTTGFTLVLVAAPGTGNSVIVDFIVVKLSPQA